MIDTLLEPFSYGYMTSAILVSTIVGGLCAFLSAYLMLKGWSLIGDALAHSVVPGVAGAYLLGLPFAIGAFISGGLAASLMLFLSERSGLKTDVVIGIIFTAFFGVGLFVVSLYPMSISIETIIMGNILAISYSDMLQLLIIGSISLAILFLKWRDLMVVFFDESHARTVGLSPSRLKIVFFTLLSASIVAALQTVGAFLVIAMVVTPGATAYLICDRFPKLILLSVLIGSVTCFTGAYLSFFIDGATGGIIVVLQTIVFLGVFLIAPKYGYISARLKIRQANKRIENGF
jgi:manganese/iron transport system permease protein